MHSRFRFSAAAALAAAIVTVPGLAGALPPGGDETGDGYSVNVQVNFSGDAAPGNGGNYTVYMPAACWWAPLSADGVDPSDPEAVWEYFKDIRPWLRGHAESGRLAWPEETVFLDAIERYEDGEKLTWYEAHCRDSDDYVELGFNMGTTEYYGEPVPVVHYPFVTGDPPEPAVDPEDLAEAARDEMVIDTPEIDRNPKGVGSLTGATLVQFPTWFWVTNPDSVGGPDGTRTIRAEVVGGNVWAEVTAQTGGLSIASPAGSQFCEPAVAMIEWQPGAADDGGCIVRFSRASVRYPDGYPVTASTEWSASWEGQTEAGELVGGDLEPLSRSESVNVPVAEIQTLVRPRD